jgi:hypothetical protein
MLDRDIQLSDLDDEETEALKQGIAMLLPHLEGFIQDAFIQPGMVKYRFGCK